MSPGRLASERLSAASYWLGAAGRECRRGEGSDQNCLHRTNERSAADRGDQAACAARLQCRQRWPPCCGLGVVCRATYSLPACDQAGQVPSTLAEGAAWGGRAMQWGSGHISRSTVRPTVGTLSLTTAAAAEGVQRRPSNRVKGWGQQWRRRRPRWTCWSRTACAR